MSSPVQRRLSPLHLGQQPPARPGPAFAATPPLARSHPTISTTEYAEIVRVSPGSIARACGRGDIPGAVRAGRK